MKTYKIDVTAEDIEHGHRNNCFLCPVALAFERITRHTIKVNSRHVSNKATGFLINKLPHSAKQFINDFDDGLPVRPFTFEIDLDF